MNNKESLNSTKDYFNLAFESGPIKSGVIAAFFLSAIILIPFIYGIIWYEHFGSDHKRILLNRLVSSICWSGIEYYTLVQGLEVLRYTVGPLPVHVCLAHLVLKNAIHIQTVLFIDVIAVVRYLFMFWLKNTFGFQVRFNYIFLLFSKVRRDYPSQMAVIKIDRNFIIKILEACLLAYNIVCLISS